MSQLYVFCRIFVVYVTIVCLLSCTQAGRPPRGGRGCGAAGGKLYILPHHCCTESKMPVSLLFSYRALEVAEGVQQLVVHNLTRHIMLHQIEDSVVCLSSVLRQGAGGGGGCGAAGGKSYILPHHCCTKSKMPVSLLFSYRALEVAEVVQQLVVHILTLHIMLHRIKDACVFTFCALTRRWRWRRVWSSWWQIINLATSLLHRIKDACVSFFCFHTGCWRWRRVCSSWWHIF
jgi:predicted small metal-binding protein